jgi:hypothetical protein
VRPVGTIATRGADEAAYTEITGEEEEEEGVDESIRQVRMNHSFSD